MNRRQNPAKLPANPRDLADLSLRLSDLVRRAFIAAPARAAAMIALLFLAIAACSPAGAAADSGVAASMANNSDPRHDSGSLKVLNWNVLYGFNHGNSVQEGIDWIRSQDPDVVALQELNGHTAASLQEMSQRWGHTHAVILKEDGFPVGLTSNREIEVIERRVEGFHHGYLHGRTHGIHFFVVHFWPGKDHEAAHVVTSIRPLLEQQRDVIVLGDFNTHSRKDAAFLATRSGVTPQFAVVDLLVSTGFVDLVHKHDPQAKYSCPSPITIPRWSESMEVLATKRQRIDFVFASESLAARSVSAGIGISERLHGISDHYPVIAEFRMPDREMSGSNQAGKQ
jgi:exodeoxyribonuclease-3